MKKKILAVFLSLCMAMSLLPVTALAADEPVASIGEQTHETLQAAVNAANSGDTIKLLADINNPIDSENHTAIVCNLPANVTLDGDGHKITGDVSIKVNAGGGTIKNINFVDIHNSATPSVTENDRYGFDNKVGKLTAIYGSSLTGKMVVTGCTFDGFDWEGIQITPQA